MKKRMLSTLLALCMALALLPGTALAARETSVTITPTSIRADSVVNCEGYGSLTINGNEGSGSLGQAALVDRDGKLVFPYRESEDDFGQVFRYYYSDGIVSFVRGAYAYYGLPEYYRLDGTKAFSLEESTVVESGEGSRMEKFTTYVGGDMNDGYAIIAEMNSWGSVSTGSSHFNGGSGSALQPTAYRIVDKNGTVTGELPEAFANVVSGASYGPTFNTEMLLNPLCGEGLFAFFELKWEYNDYGGIRIWNEGKGYMDTTGKTAINLDGRGYTKLGAFTSGLSWVVHQDGGLGYINKTGALVIPCVYEAGAAFSKDGVAYVKKDGKYGYIDKTGKTVIPFEYDAAYGAGDGLASVVKNGKCGLVDYNNNVVVSLEYDDISSYEGGVAYAVKDGYLYIIREDTPAMNQSVIQFTDEQEVDVGLNYRYTITNNTQEPMKGSYALLTYLVYPEANNASAQFFLFDLDLAAGKSVSGYVNSWYITLSQHKLYWIKFDSEAERDAFFQDSDFYYHSNEGDELAKHYTLSQFQTLDWLSNKLGTKLS